MRKEIVYEKALKHFGISASLLATELWEILEDFQKGKITKQRLCEEILIKMYKLKNL